MDFIFNSDKLGKKKKRINPFDLVDDYDYDYSEDFDFDSYDDFFDDDDID